MNKRGKIYRNFLYLGIYLLIIELFVIYLAAMMNPQFDWINSYLSDLGREEGNSYLMLNIGFIFASITMVWISFLVIFKLKINKYAKILWIIATLISGGLGAAVGIIPVDINRPLHSFFAHYYVGFTCVIQVMFGIYLWLRKYSFAKYLVLINILMVIGPLIIFINLVGEKALCTYSYVFLDDLWYVVLATAVINILNKESNKDSSKI